MKNIKLLALLSAMIFLFVSCEQKTEYKNVIPADAKAVVGINVASITEKGDFANSDMLAMMSAMMAAPKDMGVDFHSPMYVFATPDNCVGVTLKVNDKSMLEATLKSWREQGLFVSAAPVERDGMMWTTVFDACDLIYTDDICLIMASMDPEGSAISKQTASRLMDLSEEERFVNTGRYATMCKYGSKDIVVVGDIMGMPPLQDAVGQLLPNGVGINDMEAVATLNFENGKMVLTSEVMSDNDKVNYLLDSIDSQLRTLEGRYLNAPADDFLFWGSMGTTGKCLLNALKSNPMTADFQRGMNLAVDADNIIRAIEGDVTCIVPVAAINTDAPLSQCLLLAHLDNSDFLKDVDYWQTSMKKYGFSMRKVDDDQYVLNAGEYDVNWGVEGEDLFVTAGNSLANAWLSQRSTVLEKYADDIKQHKLYVYCNLSTLPMRELAQVLQINPIFGGRLTMLEAVILKAESARKMSVEIVLKNDKENFLKQLL